MEEHLSRVEHDMCSETCGDDGSWRPGGPLPSVITTGARCICTRWPETSLASRCSGSRPVTMARLSRQGSPAPACSSRGRHASVDRRSWGLGTRRSGHRWEHSAACGFTSFSAWMYHTSWRDWPEKSRQCNGFLSSPGAALCLISLLLREMSQISRRAWCAVLCRCFWRSIVSASVRFGQRCAEER